MTYAVILPTALLSFPAWPYLGWAGFFWEGRKQAKEKNSGVLVEKRGYMKNFIFLLFSILITIGVIKAGLAEQRDITRGVINSIINEKVLPRGDISTDNKAWDKEMRKWLRSWKWPAGIAFSDLRMHLMCTCQNCGATADNSAFFHQLANQSVEDTPQLWIFLEKEKPAILVGVRVDWTLV